MQTPKVIKIKAFNVAGVLALCGLGLAGCTEKTQTRKSEIKKASEPPLEIKQVETRVVKAGNEFGFDVLRRLNAEGKNANLLISPLSLSSALSMTYNGASGATQKEMAQTLRLGVLPVPQINAANAALKFNLSKAIPHNDPHIQLAIANSLWAQKGVIFNPAFLAVNKNFYDAKVTSLDLSTPAAKDAMNAWVKKSTKGKIEKMFDAPPGADARLVLMNAVYFNGKWQSQFDKSATREAPFHLPNKSEKQVPMMSQYEEHFAYAKHKDCATLTLPYGDGAMSLMLVLPDKNVALDSIVAQLSTSQWDKWQNQMQPRPGKISIPRFKMNFEIELQDTLREMGMKSAFSEVADFSKMRAQKDLFLSDVRQKAVIEVNEEGTEAAAVTEATTANTTSDDADEPFEFIADRPFLGAICDTNSGAILFLMVVREP